MAKLGGRVPSPLSSPIAGLTIGLHTRELGNVSIANVWGAEVVGPVWRLEKPTAVVRHGARP